MKAGRDGADGPVMCSSRASRSSPSGAYSTGLPLAGDGLIVEKTLESASGNFEEEHSFASALTPSGANVAGKTAPVNVGLNLHKFFAPPAYAGAIARLGLMQRITAMETARLVLLQGPAGHGKSTTLEQIKSHYEGRGWRTSWLTFDEADNDPRRFALHLQELIRRLEAGEEEVPLGDVAAESLDSRRGRRDRLVRLRSAGEWLPAGCQGSGRGREGGE